MVVTNTGKNRIRDLLVADITSGSVGTSTTPPSTNDVDLGAELTETIRAPTVTLADKSFTISHTTFSTEALDEQISEFGLKINSGAILFDRSVFPPINKTPSFEVIVIENYRVI